jgi:hypothetical protein
VKESGGPIAIHSQDCGQGWRTDYAIQVYVDYPEDSRYVNNSCAFYDSGANERSVTDYGNNSPIASPWHHPHALSIDS